MSSVININSISSPTAGRTLHSRMKRAFSLSVMKRGNVADNAASATATTTAAASAGARGTRKRGADIHIETRQGKAHAADGVPNQDMAFALARPAGRARDAGGRRHRRHRRMLAVGVFDGHGHDGHVAARLACRRMECAVEALLANAEAEDPLGGGGGGGGGGGRLTDVLGAAFRETAAVLDGAACGDGSGTTGSVVAVCGDEAAVAWVGDSVVVVVSDQSPPTVRFATPMHRVSDPAEAARVVRAGGAIQDGYVVDKDAKNGIAVTRTLGDVDMHRYGCTSEPQTARLKLAKDDAVIIVASDGLWDTDGITTDAVLRIAGDRRKRTPQRICHQLMQAVGEADGPSDDCTIACVTLR